MRSSFETWIQPSEGQTSESSQYLHRTGFCRRSSEAYIQNVRGVKRLLYPVCLVEPIPVRHSLSLYIIMNS